MKFVIGEGFPEQQRLEKSKLFIESVALVVIDEAKLCPIEWLDDDLENLECVNEETWFLIQIIVPRECKIIYLLRQEMCFHKIESLNKELYLCLVRF
jgi:hypothetical protein